MAIDSMSIVIDGSGVATYEMKRGRGATSIAVAAMDWATKYAKRKYILYISYSREYSNEIVSCVTRYNNNTRILGLGINSPLAGLGYITSKGVIRPDLVIVDLPKPYNKVLENEAEARIAALSGVFGEGVTPAIVISYSCEEL
jgi:hypothetical protein